MRAKRATSRAIPITDGERSYARTHTRLKVAGAIWALYDRLRSERDIDQAWLRTRLGRDKGYVSRLLGSPGNWTLDTVADLLEALEARIVDLEIHRRDDIDVAVNQVGHLGRQVRLGLVEFVDGTEETDAGGGSRMSSVQVSGQSWSRVQDVLEDG